MLTLLWRSESTPQCLRATPVFGGTMMSTPERSSSSSQAASPASSGEQRIHWLGTLENFTCRKSTIPKEIYQRKRLLCGSPFPGQLPTSGRALDTLINTRPVRRAAGSGRIQPSNAPSLAHSWHLSVFYKLVVLRVPSCTYVFFIVMCVESSWREPWPYLI